MKKNTIISYIAFVASFLLFTSPTKIYALNYTISFTGSGASTSVESIIVQNLTKGTTVTVPTGNVLNLSDVATSIEKVTEMTDGISIYPNPIQGKSTVTFFVKQTGSTQISIFGLDGRKIARSNNVFVQGKNSFQISLPNGIYTLLVQGNGFSYNSKLISRLNSETKSQITFTSNEIQLTNKSQKSKSAVTTMLYNSGDQLLYKGISGNFSTIITDKPTESKTINFEFVECKDADNNYYSVVKIGTQTWMAENLKATKYRDGSLVSNITVATEWNSTTLGAYCDNQNNPENSLVYGKLFNWYAITENRNICPIGWHIPTNAEWSILTTYLGGDNVAGGKLKETGITHWNSPNTGATNETGFTALSSGYRDGGSGSFSNLTNYACWWSTDFTSNPWSFFPTVFFNSEVKTTITGSKQSGFSVRCIKD